MDRRGFVVGICTLALPLKANAQPRLYRVGVVFRSGPYTTAVDGLRDGLKSLRMVEGKQYVLHQRPVTNELKSIEAAASGLELEKVDLIFAVGSTIALAAKRVTRTVPIVFFVGQDPVEFGLVASFSKPGGRLTGVVDQFVSIAPKRMEILRTLLPKARRLVTFYDPGNPVSQSAIKQARDASRQTGLELAERTVASAEELRAALGALKPREVDVIFIIGDGVTIARTDMIIAAANSKKLPVMTSDDAGVSMGALASYGLSYYTCGRLAARYVERILKGANPGDLSIERVDNPTMVINLKAAKALGITIPDAVLARADEVIR